MSYAITVLELEAAKLSRDITMMEQKDPESHSKKSSREHRDKYQEMLWDVTTGLRELRRLRGESNE